jgi:ABC-2 type transport system ATP-binding protein
MSTIASARRIVQGYRGRHIINGLDLDINIGVLGILGPNGAGKTTLLRTLATVTPPVSGSLTIDGHDIRSDADARRARRQIGFLPQDFGFFPTFTVYDFVRYCAWLRGVDERSAHQATMQALAAVDLDGHAKTRLRALSGGMLQRCGIAQAIVGDPKLVLLDEPTVGLDPEQRLAFRDLIADMPGRAVVLSTHLVEDVAASCTEVAVLVKGTIVFRGTPDDLIAAGRPDAPGHTPIERGYMSILADNAG